MYAWACGQNSVPMIGFPLSRARYANNQNAFWVMEELLSMVFDRHTLPLHMSFDGVYNGHSERFEHIIYPSNLLTEYDSSYKNEVSRAALRTFDFPQGQPLVPAGFPVNPTLIAEWEIKHNNYSVKSSFAVPYLNAPTTKSFKAAKYIDLLSHISVSENVQIYASLKREGLLGEVADEMSKIFPQIKGFDMIPYPDGSQAPVSIENKNGSYLPMYTYGDGVQKWFYILGALAVYKNSLLCIDEVDTGFHPAAQVGFCISMIQTAIKNGAQLFLTTHNIEFMKSALW